MREARGDAPRDVWIEHLKKGDMAETAESLLADAGWLPEPLRTPGRAADDDQAADFATEETPEQSSEKLPEDEDQLPPRMTIPASR